VKLHKCYGDGKVDCAFVRSMSRRGILTVPDHFADKRGQSRRRPCPRRIALPVKQVLDRRETFRCGIALSQQGRRLFRPLLQGGQLLVLLLRRAGLLPLPHVLVLEGGRSLSQWCGYLGFAPTGAGSRPEVIQLIGRDRHNIRLTVRTHCIAGGYSVTIPTGI